MLPSGRATNITRLVESPAKPKAVVPGLPAAKSWLEFMSMPAAPWTRAVPQAPSRAVAQDPRELRADVAALAEEGVGEVTRVADDGRVAQAEPRHVDHHAAARRQHHLRAVVGSPAAHLDAQRVVAAAG